MGCFWLYFVLDWTSSFEQKANFASSGSSLTVPSRPDEKVLLLLCVFGPFEATKVSNFSSF